MFKPFIFQIKFNHIFSDGTSSPQLLPISQVDVSLANVEICFFFFLCPLSKHIPVKNLSQFLFYFVFSGIIMEGGAIHLRIQRALHILLSYFLAALGTANCTFLLLLLGLGSVTKHSVSHTFCLFLLGYCPSCTSFFSSSVNQGIFGLLVFLTMLHYSFLQLFVMYMIPKLYV